jgi:hypothetical protein
MAALGGGIQPFRAVLSSPSLFRSRHVFLDTLVAGGYLLGLLLAISLLAWPGTSKGQFRGNRMPPPPALPPPNNLNTDGTGNFINVVGGGFNGFGGFNGLGGFGGGFPGGTGGFGGGFNGFGGLGGFNGLGGFGGGGFAGKGFGSFNGRKAL